MKTLKYAPLYIAALLTVIFIGCSKSDNINNPTQSTQAAISTEPSDNSTAVRLDKTIQLTFAKPIDKNLVEKNFHLINQYNMLDSLCNFGKSNMHGDMSMVMMDSSKMNHFMNDHGTPGRFNWNSDFTQCTFTPDSLLQSNTQYMMHFGEEMIDMMEDKMGDMMSGGMMENGKDGMTGMGSGEMQGHMMWHFTTIDTTDTGSGHNGHH